MITESIVTSPFSSTERSLCQVLTLVAWRLLWLPAGVMGVLPVCEVGLRGARDRPRPWPPVPTYTALVSSAMMQGAFAMLVLASKKQATQSSPLKDLSYVLRYLVLPLCMLSTRALRRHRLCRLLIRARAYWLRHPMSGEVKHCRFRDSFPTL